MTPHTTESSSFENEDRLSIKSTQDHRGATKVVKVKRTAVVDERNEDQKKLHDLADKSGREILDALKSSSTTLDIREGLEQFISVAADESIHPEPTRHVSGGVLRPGELVPDELARTITRYEMVEIPSEAVRDKMGRSYATGKRKDAVAQVWIKPGTGKITVNGQDAGKYFFRPVLQMILRQPFQVAGVEGKFDVNATVKGGGLSGQAGAVKHGISKALQLYDPGLRAALKAAGFLTRDSRVVERKKYGKAKARRSFLFSKR